MSLTKNGIPKTHNLFFASKAIIIADKVNFLALWLAKKTGCFVIHRLDEHFQQNEPYHRRKKHARIIKINKLSDVTVFQSEFVKNNVLPYLKTKNYKVIINGGNPEIFYDKRKNRRYIGHVTNSVGGKKRLDLLEKVVVKYPNESFLLVGNHKISSINFCRYQNVTMVGPVPSEELAKYYQMMKCLYFPSENDPCPNTVVEAILSGVPVCYNPIGGTVEIVRDCGVPLEKFGLLPQRLPELRGNCAKRDDLHFDRVIKQYLDL